MTTRARITPRETAMERLRGNATVSVYDAMSVLRMGEPTVRDAIRRGDIASLRLGRNVRVLSAPLLRQLGMSEDAS